MSFPQRSTFFNPDEFNCYVHGFSEYLWDACTLKPLGSRPIETPDRPMGSPGRTVITISENVVLTKGLKTVTVKASPQQPRRCIAMIEAICGRTKETKI